MNTEPSPTSSLQTSPRSISQLGTLVAGLPAADRVRFEQIFHLSLTQGEVVPPDTMHEWLTRQFDSVDAVRRQTIVKVTNRITLEGTLFNGLRASRPMDVSPHDDLLEGTIKDHAGGPFCQPHENTPADTFGRIRGDHCLTASNVAKYDGWHGVIIFDEHHPLHLTAERIRDYVDTYREWVRAAHEADPKACYPFLLWNCLWRAGASILHGHAQITLTRGMHYARVENWRRAARSYRLAYGTDYFDDLLAVHRALDLVEDQGGVAIFPSLTPFKEKETCLIGPRLDEDLTSALYHVLRTFVEELGVQSFNVALYQPPLCETPEDWGGFPCIVRVIDRGDLQAKVSDIGAMEIFAQSVVATDPFRVADALRGAHRA